MFSKFPKIKLRYIFFILNIYFYKIFYIFFIYIHLLFWITLVKYNVYKYKPILIINDKIGISDIFKLCIISL